MKNRWFACLLAIALAYPVLCPAQESSGNPAADSLASYIKGWRWESADGRSTIDASSSSLLLFDGKLYDYDLSGAALRFTSGGSSVPYRYDPATDLLTLTFADTAQVVYHPTIQSVLARRGTRRLPEKAEFLFGQFATAEKRLADGAAEQRTINFHANTEFDFGPRGSTTAGGAAGGASSTAALGTVLVYGDAIIFSFYDSSAAEADVQLRDSRGDVRSFIYADEVYTRVPYNAALLPTPEPSPVPEPVPGPPPVYPIPPMDPPYYPPYYPPYHPPVYYPPYYYPPVVTGGPIMHPHAGGGKDGHRSGGDTRTTGVHRGSAGGSSSAGTSRSSGSSSGSYTGRGGGSSRSGGSYSGGSSGGRGGSSGSHGGGSSGGSSRGGTRR